MRVADASVAVAAFGPWHEQHRVAKDALKGRPSIAAHAAIETYSVLTRMPDPHRVRPADAQAYLYDMFGRRWLGLAAEAQRALLDRLAGVGVRGGAVYDALIAATAAAENATLVTLDRRALETYRRLEVEIELVA